MATGFFGQEKGCFFSLDKCCPLLSLSGTAASPPAPGCSVELNGASEVLVPGLKLQG